jgi:hypothetical protein
LGGERFEVLVAYRHAPSTSYQRYGRNSATDRARTNSNGGRPMGDSVRLYGPQPALPNRHFSEIVAVVNGWEPTISRPRRAIPSGLLRDIVVNPGLKSERDRRRSLPALQGEVTGADRMADGAVTDPNRQAPQPHALPRPVRLHPLGSRRLETRYIWWRRVCSPMNIRMHSRS